MNKNFRFQSNFQCDLIQIYCAISVKNQLSEAKFYNCTAFLARYDDNVFVRSEAKAVIWSEILYLKPFLLILYEVNLVI